MSDTPRTDAMMAQYAHHLPDWLAERVYAPLCRVLERELAEAIEQRDTLAEALIIIAYRIHSVDYCGEIAEKALAAVKGGSHE